MHFRPFRLFFFKFYDIHPATNETQFTFQVDTGTNTSYNQTITSSFFRSKHNEADGGTGVEYKGEQDQAQGTSFQKIAKLRRHALNFHQKIF